MLKVISRLGREHTWLFGRGFDASDFLQTLMTLQIHWVVRQTQSRHVLLGDGELAPMHLLATGLRKPHAIEVPYVDKSNHEPKFAPASLGFAPMAAGHLRRAGLLRLPHPLPAAVRQPRAAIHGTG